MTRIITEELSNAQKRRVDGWKKTTNAVDISKHVIAPGTDRVTIPLNDPHDQHVEAPDHIKEHFDKHGITVHDYASGYVKDKYNRTMKLGKALQQTNADPALLQHFNTDPNRATAKQHGNLQVVISRHPYDVAGMSTNRGWESCMDMDTGMHKEFVHREVKNGTHVAYLTQKGDDVVKNPIARIALKPFSSEDGTHHLLRPEDKQYGTSASSFEHTVHSWANEHFKPKEDQVYQKAKGSYNDSDLEKSVIIPKITNDIIHHNLKGMEVMRAGDLPDSHPAMRKDAVIQHIAKHGTDEHRNIIADHFVKHEYAPYAGTAMNLAEHGTDEIHKKLISIPNTDHYSPHLEALAEHGSDEIRHQILKHDRVSVWAAQTALMHMSPDADTKQYTTLKTPLSVRNTLANTGRHHDILKNDPEQKVRASVARTTKDKSIFDELTSDDHVRDMVKTRSKNYSVWHHPVNQAAYNPHFGGREYEARVEHIQNKMIDDAFYKRT